MKILISSSLVFGHYMYRGGEIGKHGGKFITLFDFSMNFLHGVSKIIGWIAQAVNLRRWGFESVLTPIIINLGRYQSGHNGTVCKTDDAWVRIPLCPRGRFNKDFSTRSFIAIKSLWQTGREPYIPLWCRWLLLAGLKIQRPLFNSRRRNYCIFGILFMQVK